MRDISHALNLNTKNSIVGKPDFSKVGFDD
jgi:hypothetical protein